VLYLQVRVFHRSVSLTSIFFLFVKCMNKLRWKTNGARLGEWIIHRMERSWFRVVTKVERVNDNLFFKLLWEQKPTEKSMDVWGEDEWIQNENEVNKLSNVWFFHFLSARIKLLKASFVLLTRYQGVTSLIMWSNITFRFFSDERIFLFYVYHEGIVMRNRPSKRGNTVIKTIQRWNVFSWDA
jgi:hypothetical protein